MFVLYADKTQLAVREKEPVTSGSVNVYLAQFEFSDDWDGLTRTAVFQAGSVSRSVLLDESGTCTVPWEVLKTPRISLAAGVCGEKDGDVVLPTVWAWLGLIMEGAAPGEDAQPPTPDLWEQELAKKQDKLHGQADQLVGFDDQGNAVPVDAAEAMQGPPGPGVPPGGSPGQVLTKKTAADYDTQWSDPAGGGADINTGDGLSKDGDTISVDNPVRGVYTQAEYDALTEAQKAKGTYFVGDGSTDASNLLRIISNGESLGLPIGPIGPAGPDGNPIGSIISYMGVTAPKDYLICDGATYPIADYPDLADFFQAQFGSKNYFGGDGTTTFAVPDMRNLFLRGYHGDAEEQLSGDVGVKQEGTNFPYFYGRNSLWMSKSRGSYAPNNPDTLTDVATNMGAIDSPLITGSTIYDGYTSRPVNMAVLYCIKAVDSSLTGDIYSLEERVVGRWIDGRPVYRITAVVKSPTTLLVWGKVNAPIPNAEGKFLGVSMIDNSGTVSAFPMVQDNYFIKAVYSNDGVGFPDGAGFYVYNNRNSWANQLLILNLYYTKTTDQPTIELPAALTPANTQTLYKAAPQSAAAVTLDAGIKTEEV